MYVQSTARLRDADGQTGISVQLSFRDGLRLSTTITDKTQLLEFGYDFKRSNNDLKFGGFQVFNSNTHIHQLLVLCVIGKPTDAGMSHAFDARRKSRRSG
ncbi:hypothetical protein [Paraburkholderia fynbosensis]|uniref:Uncharacterized protein n=1 Tax=Paraburkholderia fynbosensis TaxID=1200993 RepID=A0A6J5GD77_9BURK|nr:hypothetical protein LMG27177_04395 [Paraburkholderia fynbosensis]